MHVKEQNRSFLLGNDAILMQLSDELFKEKQWFILFLFWFIEKFFLPFRISARGSKSTGRCISTGIYRLLAFGITGTC